MRRTDAGSSIVEPHVNQANPDGRPCCDEKYGVEPAVVEVEVDVAENLLAGHKFICEKFVSD